MLSAFFSIGIWNSFAFSVIVRSGIKNSIGQAYGIQVAPALRMCGDSALLSPRRVPVACLLCGEERGPVLEEGEGAGVLVGGDNEEKFLPVSGDVKANHALAIDTQRGTEGEEDGGVSDVNAV